MWYQLLLRAGLGLAATFWLPMAAAQVSAPLSPEEARSWLSRIHNAASQRNYQGTLVFSAGGTVSSSQIAHYCEGQQQLERIEALDGQARRVFRHNEVVQTVWPGSRVAVIEQRDPLTPFPALLRGDKEGLIQHYELVAEGEDRVAGHEAQVLRLRPRDGHRFGQRLWAEKTTGLLLRADILGPRDEVLETAAFSQLVLGVKAQPESVLAPMKKLRGYRVVRPSYTRTHLEDEGWTLQSPVAGFQQISCVKRPLETALSGDAPPEVLQAIFSDGLTHVSVFIEPYQPQQHQRAMTTAIGATHTLMRQHDSWWITVMGDVPVTTLKQFAQALERRR